MEEHTAMPISIALLLGLGMMQSVRMPSPILFIAREPLVAGRENAYREIEEETARLSARLGCPHRYLAIRLAASIPDSTIGIVQPSFSFPAKDWVAADPRFRRANAR